MLANLFEREFLLDVEIMDDVFVILRPLQL
jgi:hypothetical protein